jgi:hypothetical protein
MKAKLTKEEVFTLEVAGLKFPGLRVESRWEGLTKLVNEKGESLVICGEREGRNFGTAFNDLFGDILGCVPTSTDMAIVMASPGLLAQILAAQKEAA